MTRCLSLLALISLAGCSAPPGTDIEVGAGHVAASAASSPRPANDRYRKQRTAPADTPSPMPPAEQRPVDLPPEPATGVPTRFQGTYAIDAVACRQPAHETRLSLTETSIQFHESSGPVELAKVDGDTLLVRALLTGEGETRPATYRFQLDADGQQLTDADHGMVRQRCP